MGWGDWFRGRYPKGEKPGPAGAIAMEDEIVTMLKARGLIPADAEVSGILPAGARGLPFASAHAVEPVITWPQWTINMGDQRIPGWAPCRFGNRFDDEGRIGWVYGVAKGDFGIWTNVFPVCHHPQTESDGNFASTAILAAVTHLFSGHGMGLFHDAATAAIACDAIQPLREWHAAPPDVRVSEAASLAWRDLMGIAYRTWEFNGIDHSQDWHAHIAPGGPETGIWTRNEAFVTANRPEKTS